LILNVLEFLITGTVSLIRYEFTHQDVVLILNVLGVIFLPPFIHDNAVFRSKNDSAVYFLGMLNRLAMMVFEESIIRYLISTIVVLFLLFFDSWINAANYMYAVMLSRLDGGCRKSVISKLNRRNNRLGTNGSQLEAMLFQTSIYLYRTVLFPSPDGMQNPMLNVTKKRLRRSCFIGMNLREAVMKPRKRMCKNIVQSTEWRTPDEPLNC